MNGFRMMTTLGLFLMMLAAPTAAEEAGESPELNEVATVEPTGDSMATPVQYVVTYFHGDRRCATCMKLESYSHAAIAEAFAEELADSTLLWRTVNYDDEANRHFFEEYGLYAQAVIVSRREAGEEADWVNLDKIWDLVGDSTKFARYVKSETGKFVTGAADDE